MLCFLVPVHYSVSVQGGGYFDSSRQKGVPFRFKLGQGTYIATRDSIKGSWLTCDYCDR